MDVWEHGDPLPVHVDWSMGVDTDDLEQLPEVHQARALGWEPAHEAPLWCFLPAVWPREHRAWFPDRRIRHSRGGGLHDQAPGRVPWHTAVYADIEASHNRLLDLCGLPPRPFGRVWLLRTQPGHPSVAAVLDIVSESYARGHDVMADRQFAAHTRDVLARVFSE